MPFVTEYNQSQVLKKLIGEIPENIKEWQPYKKEIFYLNRLDKTILLYIMKFCENPVENIGIVYTPINKVDDKKFVFVGGIPSYHKYESCERLSSNFVNFRIPEEIKKKGDEAIEEFRKWFKENQIAFTEKPDLYQMRLLTKYNISQGLEKVDYQNSGNVYKENLTLLEIETRIDSLLHHAANYYKEDTNRQEAIRRFQTSTFLALKPDKIDNNHTGFTDDELKTILKEYHFLFVQPTVYFLKEHFKTFFNTKMEISERIFELLKFKKCTTCYAEDYVEKSHNLSEKKRKLLEVFGDFEFPVEPTLFYPKSIENSSSTIAFIYCLIFRCIDNEFAIDVIGKYKRYKAQFINHKNLFVYVETKIYESDIANIRLFKKYITKIEKDLNTRETTYTTYPYEI